MPKIYQNSRYYIVNVSMKNLSKIIREFEELSYKGYERRRPKHDPTDSYFYLARQLENCMIRSDSLNLHVYPVRTESTTNSEAKILHVCNSKKSELKEILVD